MGRCLMCQEEGKLTNEHIIPAWTATTLLELSPLTPEHGNLQAAIDAAPAGATQWFNRAVDVKVKGLCGRCNSAQEGGAQVLLEPLIRGETRRLNTAEQTLLATWAHAKSLAMGLFDGRPNPELGQAMRAFRSRGRPPLQTQLWIGQFDMSSTWPDMPASLRVGGLTLRRKGHDAEATVSVIHIANLIIVGCRWHHEAIQTFNLPPGLLPAGALTPIWPAANQHVTWPAAIKVRYADLKAMDVWDGQGEFR